MKNIKKALFFSILIGILSTIVSIKIMLNYGLVENYILIKCIYYLTNGLYFILVGVLLIIYRIFPDSSLLDGYGMFLGFGYMAPWVVFFFNVILYFILFIFVLWLIKRMNWPNHISYVLPSLIFVLLIIPFVYPSQLDQTKKCLNGDYKVLQGDYVKKPTECFGETFGKRLDYDEIEKAFSFCSKLSKEKKIVISNKTFGHPPKYLPRYSHQTLCFLESKNTLRKGVLSSEPDVYYNNPNLNSYTLSHVKYCTLASNYQNKPEFKDQC
jgi:hypothetical protein